MDWISITSYPDSEIKIRIFDEKKNFYALSFSKMNVLCLLLNRLFKIEIIVRK